MTVPEPPVKAPTWIRPRELTAEPVPVTLSAPVPLLAPTCTAKLPVVVCAVPPFWTVSVPLPEAPPTTIMRCEFKVAAPPVPSTVNVPVPLKPTVTPEPEAELALNVVMPFPEALPFRVAVPAPPTAMKTWLVVVKGFEPAFSVAAPGLVDPVAINVACAGNTAEMPMRKSRAAPSFA